MAPKKPVTPEYFRDKLTTVDATGKRVWIYAKKIRGPHFTYRSIVAAFLLILFYSGPFIKIHGDPIMLFDILHRRFIIFGIAFWPQDFHLILLSVITTIVFIVLFTVVFGRIFCGWVCPQTIFLEFVFRRIEYLIEGDAAAQRRRDNGPMNMDKLWRKTLKHVVFYVISLITATTFLSYIIGFDRVKHFLLDDPIAHWGSFSGLFVFAGAFYFIFAFFREQVCTIACPYGRLQSVLVDKKTILVAYDFVRGEPRGPLKLQKTENLGDCIDCNSCVVVCPTGIDIRNGTQMECINCTACIDACDTIMTKVNKPKGLIRYDSEEGIKTGKHSIFNMRSIAYSVVLTLLLFFVASLFMFRGNFESTILRASGSMYQNYGTDSLSNIYTFDMVNKTNRAIDVTFKVESMPGRIQYIGDHPPVEVGHIGKGTFLVILPIKALHSSQTTFKIGMYEEGNLIEMYKTSFVGPSSLDK
ncbi:MAG: cytochrome c oxidase accessory protein CcoG [Bacteroidales bacterium]|nr:cytochrome c oxidase accessory protein CcoG [Bacteroidales bacterium]